MNAVDVADRVVAGRLEPDRQVAGDVAGDDGQAEAEGFEHRDRQALVRRGEHEGGGVLVELPERLARLVAGAHDAGRAAGQLEHFTGVEAGGVGGADQGQLPARAESAAANAWTRSSWRFSGVRRPTQSRYLPGSSPMASSRSDASSIVGIPTPLGTNVIVTPWRSGMSSAIGRAMAMRPFEYRMPANSPKRSMARAVAPHFSCS